MTKKWKERRKEKRNREYGVRLLCLLFTLAFLWEQLPLMPARAAAQTQEMANLVIFVKYKGDARDVFNAGTNWRDLKKAYNENIFNGHDNSFANYIYTVTEGKVKVTNYFPQERADGSGVDTLELSGSVNGYSEDSLVKEVISALKNKKINIDVSKYKLDNQISGYVDNLTILVQGDTINGEKHGFHRRYNGTTEDVFNGLKILDFNGIPSGFLVEEDGTGMSPSQEVAAHEFLHTLGLTDLYRFDNSGEPVGNWDIMAKTVDNYPLSYTRAQQGWVEMRTITKSGTYTLTAVSESGGDKIFALRTPLSDSETICLEYRKKQETGRFDHYIPSSGLLMYRVDEKAGGANSAGDNYIYVYRPGVTHPENAADRGSNGMNLVQNAALDASKGETSYGTTDLSADFTQDTLYYSDGSNSGISISGLKISPDGNQATFTVTFADYTAPQIWTKLGDKVGGSCIGEPMIYTDPSTGAIYTAYIEGSGLVGKLLVKRWNGTAWQQVGQAVDKVSVMGETALTVCAGTLYLSYINANGNPVYCRLNGNSWNVLSTPGVSWPLYMQFVTDGTAIYGAYQVSEGTSARLVICDPRTGGVITNSLTAGDFRNPALVKSGNYIYLLYSDAPSGRPVIRSYDIAAKKWSMLHTFLSGSSASNNINIHQIKIQDGKIYAFAGDGNAKSYMLSVYDGSSWKDIGVSGMGSTPGVSMDIIGGRVYLTYYDTDVRKGKVLCYNGSGFELFSDTLGTGYAALRTGSYGNKLYAVSKAENTYDVVVREKAVQGVTPPDPTDPPKPVDPPKPIDPPGPTDPTNPPVVQKPLTLALTPPAGYGDDQIFIDGVEYTAVRQGGSLTLKLPDTAGKTAVMYRYDEKGIPVGMYVWKLSWTGELCTATAMPGLQDLLSYHGFSIRVQSPAGIRFKSGIDQNLKKQLIAGNVEGCRLAEYGTLFITNENRKQYPFVKGGTKVGGGRAYWTENGTVNDKVFETVGGRNRFTSVLINLAPNMFAKDISFRAYAILECDGQELCIYGPPVYRSVYTVAKQVQARGEFKVGSSGYRYVQSIIDSVEGR